MLSGKQYKNKMRSSTEIENIKQQKNILELKNILTELKIQQKASPSDFTNQKRICELEDKSLEDI